MKRSTRAIRRESDRLLFDNPAQSLVKCAARSTDPADPSHGRHFSAPASPPTPSPSSREKSGGRDGSGGSPQLSAGESEAFGDPSPDGSPTDRGTDRSLTPALTQTLTLRIPVRAATSQNARFMNPFARAALVKKERRTTKQAFEAVRGAEVLGQLARDARYLVKLVRIGPNELDAEDNLPGSLKAVKDELAELLGLKSDRDRRIRWAFDQRSEGYVEYRDPKTGRKRKTGIFAVEVLVRRQVCADCFVEHCECIHGAESCADCEAA
jgi:hypothetical protein